MDDPAPQRVLRIRRFRAHAQGARGYRFSYEASDERDGQLIARCDVVGNAALVPLSIVDRGTQTWLVTPNRAVLPTSWTVGAGTDAASWRLDAGVARRLLNPLHRTSLTLHAPDGTEIGQLLDPRTAVADRILGAGPREWALVRDHRLLAKLHTLPARPQEPVGWLRALARALTESNRGFVTLGPEHLLPAPVVVGLLALHDELTTVT